MAVPVTAMTARGHSFPGRYDTIKAEVATTHQTKDLFPGDQ